jgi:hypothetical protein
MSEMLFTKSEETLLRNGSEYNIRASPLRNVKHLILEIENTIKHRSIYENQQEPIRYLAAK